MYDYYRGSNLYLDAVENQLKSIFEESGFPISSQDSNSTADLKNSIQANTDALKQMEKGIQRGIAAGAVAMYGISQGIRSDIQANTEVIQNAADGIRTDIRESTYATLRMGLELSNDIQNNTNAIQDMATGLNSAIRENTYTLIASQQMLQETITQGFNAFCNAMGIGFDITNKNLAEAVKKLDEIHDILNNPILTQSRELYRRAVDNYTRGLYEEALEDGLGAVEKNKTDFISWYLLGHIYLFGAGKFSNVINVDKAEEAFANAAKYIDYDLGKSEEANRLGSEIYYYLGYSRLIKSNDLLVENRNDESVKKLEEAVKASSESYRLSEKNLVAVYEQAKELHFLGRDDEALQIIENLIRIEKSYAYRVANDKNFESLWGQIEEIIKRLAVALTNEMIPSIEELSAQLKKILYSSKIVDWRIHFEDFRRKLPHSYEFENKDYFTIRNYYETTYLSFKSSFENEISSFFHVHDWNKYEQACELYISDTKEKTLNALEALIRENSYFAIKSTCDKKLENIWGDVEIIIDKLKKELCQQIKEKFENTLEPYIDIINNDTAFSTYPLPPDLQYNKYGKTPGEICFSLIEQFRPSYSELETNSYFYVRNVWEMELPTQISQLTIVLNAAVREIRAESENKKRLEKLDLERKQHEEEQRKLEEKKAAENLARINYNKKSEKKCKIIGTLIGLIIGLAVGFVSRLVESSTVGVCIYIIAGSAAGLIVGLMDDGHGIFWGIIGGAVISFLYIILCVFLAKKIGDTFFDIMFCVGPAISGSILGNIVGDEVYTQKFYKI